MRAAGTHRVGRCGVQHHKSEALLLPQGDVGDEELLVEEGALSSLSARGSACVRVARRIYVVNDNCALKGCWGFVAELLHLQAGRVRTTTSDVQSNRAAHGIHTIASTDQVRQPC